ncbi:MAG: FHA domain-containing protein, partial [Vicinamibacteria bacterium]
MERVIFLEVLDRRGRVRERLRLSRLPATVGRSYTNDVILEDRFVSPLHCTILENGSGQILLEDHESLNGVRVLSEGSTMVPRSTLVLRSGERFRVGETVLRLVESDHPVSPAEPLPMDESGILHSLRDPRLALAAILASLAVMVASEYLGAYYDTSFAAVVSPVALGLGALGLWSGIWAFANRLLTHRFDYLRHFACACLSAVGYILVAIVSQYADFVFSSPRLGSGLDVAGQAATTLALVSAHLAVIPASTRRGRRYWAAGGTALLLGLVVLFNNPDTEDLVSEIPVAVPLKAVGASLIP